VDKNRPGEVLLIFFDLLIGGTGAASSASHMACFPLSML